MDKLSVKRLDGLRRLSVLLRRFLIAAPLLVGLALASGPIPAALSANSDVNTTDDTDDGTCNPIHCSLREAINWANAHPGDDTIGFDIPGPAPHVIVVDPAMGELPELTDAGTTIDGTTQPGYTGSPVVEVTWIGSPPVLETALRVSTDDTTVRGLALTGWHAGVLVHSPTATNTLVEDNFIGLSTSGAAAANGLWGIAVHEGASSTQILNNVISGHQVGIEVGAAPSLPPGNTLIEGNLVGTDPTGTLAIGNSNTGVAVFDSLDTTVRNNVISGNGYSSVAVSAGGLFINGATNVAVEGNMVGTNASGTGSLPNFDMGITIYDTASPTSGVAIGGPSPGQRNIISGNYQHGIWVLTDNVVIQGNYIGTDVTGTVPLGNSSEGIHVGTGDNTLIGGSNPGEGNVISGNQSLAITLDTAAADATIQGNLIGPDQSGSVLLGNLGGILVASIYGSALIGGPNPDEGNVIAGNTHNGIWFWPDEGVSGNQVVGNEIYSNGDHGIYLDRFSFEGALNNTLSQNAIYNNGGLGIKLENGSPGPTPNDIGDGDSGPNDLMNYPLMIGANTTGASLLVHAEIVDGLPNTLFRVEFFGNSTCDPSGNGEGQTFLGDVLVVTNGGGDADPGTQTYPVTIPPAQYVTATATMIDGTTPSSTSEFSQCALVTQIGLLPHIEHIRTLYYEFIPPGPPPYYHGLVTSLDAKLDAAIKQLNRGNDRAAINQMNAFINHVEALVKRGTFQPEQGDLLINEAEAVIAAIQRG